MGIHKSDRIGLGRCGAVPLLIAMGLYYLWHPGQAVSAAHPHVDKPACVVTASAPGATDANHEVVAGGDSMSVTQWRVNLPPPDPFNLGTYKRNHTKKVSFLAVRRGGTGVNPNKLFRASYDGFVIVSILGDYTNAGFITLYSRHTQPPMAADMEVWSVAGSPDGTKAVSGTNFGEIDLWDAETGIKLGRIAGETSFYPVGGLVFLPPPASASAPQQFLAARDGGEVVLYNIVPPSAMMPDYTFTVAHTFSHENDLAVNSVAISTDGKTAVSGGFDMTVRIWDVEHLTPKGSPITAHRNVVWRVAISPDDKMIATASEDGSVRLFNMADGSAVMDGGMPAFKEETDGAGTKLGVMGVTWVTRDKVVYTVGKDPPNPNDPIVKVWDVSALNTP